ncbi:MAG: DUF2272 domain-containing protein [Alphaproteobacteria bacterium]|nr:DUF2272 domain-containing protein [Alphaproteobacteria bacterium]
MRLRGLAPSLIAATLASCAARPPVIPRPPPDAHLPTFARAPYEALSRQSVVAIALREWRLFGQNVDDDPPDTRPPPTADQKPERWPGLWQRVGEYWWLAVDPSDRAVGWTGKHDEHGVEFPASEDGRFAWSAAFISYIMRIAGAGPRFPYAATHARYINVAKQMALRQTSGWAIVAERPEAYAPQPGDIICAGRGLAVGMRFDNLPTAQDFPSHCDIVVQVYQGQLAVIGGNVDDTVTLKHVPTTPDGKLAGPDGTAIDTRYPWMVVLRVLYPSPVNVYPSPVS